MTDDRISSSTDGFSPGNISDSCICKTEDSQNDRFEALEPDTTYVIKHDIITGFDEFCNFFTELQCQLNSCRTEKSQLEKNLYLLYQRNSTLETECQAMRDSVKETQGKMDLLFDLEDENRSLKAEVDSKNQAIQKEVEKREDDLKTLTYQKTVQIQDIEQNLTEEHNLQVQELESQIHHSAMKIQELKDQLDDANQEKQNSEDKIVMEYESKLRAANVQKADYQQQQRQLLNQDVMRRKMQHLERENLTLRQANRHLQVNQQQHQQRPETGQANSQPEGEVAEGRGYGGWPPQARRQRGRNLFLRKP